MTDIQPHHVVDRPGPDGKRTALTIERGQLPRWPIKLTVVMGYGDTVSLFLDGDECAELISAVELQVGPDPRIAELEAERDEYKTLFEQHAKLAEQLSEQIVALRDGAR
jgi:hypothetical protein